MPNRIVIPEVSEPAHPMIIELSDLLRSVYVFIRDKYQEVINQAFDQASREIGFVVATTLPMTFEVGDKGKVKSFAVPNASPLMGTLIEKRMTLALKPLADASLPITKPGSYTIYLIWVPALKLKLRKDWFEPAHWRGPWTEPAHLAQRLAERAQLEIARQTPAMVWESHEPAHWFNPAIKITDEDALHITLLDEIYPDLRLVDRVAAARQALPQIAQVAPEVQEPAHFRQIIATIPELPKEMLAELAQVLRRYGY